MTVLIDTAIPMIALALIERYGNEASARVANRARLLEACGDRQTSQNWILIFREINKFETYSSRRHTRSSNNEFALMYDRLKCANAEAVGCTDQGVNNFSVRGEPAFERVEETEKLSSIYATVSEISGTDILSTQSLPPYGLIRRTIRA